MFLYKTRKHYNRARRFRVHVLTTGLALPLVISASYSLQAAACVLIAMTVVTVPMILLASLVGKYIPALVRTPLYALCSMLLLVLLEPMLIKYFPAVLDSLGVYFPIIAVNTLMLYFCEKKSLWGHPLRALATAVLELLGFAAVLGMVAVVRELFGSGMLWGVTIPAVTWKMNALLIPFGGLMVAAFLAAAFRTIGRLTRRILYRSDLRRYNERGYARTEPSVSEEKPLV